MLALCAAKQGSRESQLNILPCKIHCNGPSKVTRRFWLPVTEQDGSKTAYFRGRKLRGRRIRIPNSYHGIAVSRSHRTLASAAKTLSEAALERSVDDSPTEDDEPAEPVRLLQEEVTVSEMTVWGHDRMPTADDAFVKGIEEWISFAEAIHTTPMDFSSSKTSSQS